VSVPLRNYTDAVVGCLTLAAPSARLNSESHEEYLLPLKRTAAQIENQLGGVDDAHVATADVAQLAQQLAEHRHARTVSRGTARRSRPPHQQRPRRYDEPCPLSRGSDPAAGQTGARRRSHSALICTQRRSLCLQTVSFGAEARRGVAWRFSAFHALAATLWSHIGRIMGASEGAAPT
jgi:hypothetical protein